MVDASITESENAIKFWYHITERIRSSKYPPCSDCKFDYGHKVEEVGGKNILILCITVRKNDAKPQLIAKIRADKPFVVVTDSNDHADMIERFVRGLLPSATIEVGKGNLEWV